MNKWLIVAGAIAIGVLIVLGLSREFWPPRDLRIVSVEVVSSLDRATIHDVGVSRDPNEILARVEFKTRTDLYTYGYNSVYEGLYVHAYLCPLGGDEDSGKMKVQSELVYDAKGVVGMIDRPSQLPAPDRAGDRVFHIYIYLRSKRFSSDYDLIKMQRDICFTLVPHFPYGGYWPPSNEVRVSSSALRMR